MRVLVQKVVQLQIEPLHRQIARPDQIFLINLGEIIFREGLIKGDEFFRGLIGAFQAFGERFIFFRVRRR